MAVFSLVHYTYRALALVQFSVSKDEAWEVKAYEIDGQAQEDYMAYFFPKSNFKSVAPTFLWRPNFVVGTPVDLAIFCLNVWIPSSLDRLNENPYFFLRPMIACYSWCKRHVVAKHQRCTFILISARS